MPPQFQNALSLPDIRLQIAALILAEEMNFTRAAERLGITQPALSKQIAELENRLGFIVFDRGQKKTSLTEAGQVFIRGCRDAQAILERAVRLGKAAKEEARPIITIGHSPYVDPAIITAILGVHLPIYPTLRLRMESMFAPELVHSVMSGELDLAVVAEAADSAHLTRVPITIKPLYVLMSVDHPAALQRVVSIGDLGEAGWLIFPRRANPVIYERILDAARSAGVSPIELHHYVAPQEVLPLIAENFGVAFMSRGKAEQISGPNLVARPIEERSLEVTNSLVLRADQSSRLVNGFGRALLKRILPNATREESWGQLRLDL